MFSQRTYRRNIFTRPEVVWNLYLAVLTLWAVFRIPADIVMGQQTGYAYNAMDFLLVATYMIDPVITYRLIRKRSLSARGTYLRYLLPLDIVAAIAVLPIFHGSAVSLLGLLKLIHVTTFVTVWRHQLLRRGNLIRLVQFLYWLGALIHLTASGWMYIRVEPAGSPIEYEYLRAVYWSVATLGTIGYGDIVAQNQIETVYSIGVMLTGFLMMGYLIGNIASLLNKPDPLRAQYANALEEISAFAQYHRLPGHLKHRIIDYFGYMWQQRAAFADTNILNTLPSGIRTEISLHLKRDVIHRVPFFREAEDHFIREIANEMKQIVVTPGEYVFHVGDPATSMYFISRGDLEVLDSTDALIGSLTDGDFFGEMALLEKRRRMGSVRALDYCEIFELSAKAFDQIVEAHPSFRRYMQEIAQQRTTAIVAAS